MGRDEPTSCAWLAVDIKDVFIAPVAFLVPSQKVIIGNFGNKKLKSSHNFSGDSSPMKNLTSLSLVMLVNCIATCISFPSNCSIYFFPWLAFCLLFDDDGSSSFLLGRRGGGEEGGINFLLFVLGYNNHNVQMV